MDIAQILDELDNLVDKSSRSLLFRSKKLVPEEDFKYYINSLRKECHSAEESQRIIKERENILKQASLEAEAIIKQAKERAIELASKDEVYIKAEEAAKELERKAQEKLAKTEEDCEKLFKQATEYAQSILKSTNKTLEHSLTDISNLRTSLMEAAVSLENYRPNKKEENQD